VSDLKNERTRIVITGLGAVCSAGRTADQLWQTLNRRQSGNNHTTSDVNEPGHQGTPGVAEFSGTIKDFGDLPDAKRKFIRKSLKLMNRETQMGVAAGQQALSDSGVLEQYDPDRFGVCFGADNVSIMPRDFQRGIQACTSPDGTLEMERWGADGLDEIAPLWILKCLPNMPACHLAIANDLRGPSNTITQRDVSANLAIAEACRNIRAGDADAVLVGGTGTTLTPINHMHARMEDEINENDAICRPFDRRRAGSASGEGAGAVVLEEMHSAVQRHAHIYGEIMGAASASLVGTAGQANCRRALTVSLAQVLDRAGWAPSEIGHIHAHGLGTWASDVAEAQAIRDILGQENAKTPVVAAKSHLANSAAGAGALELIASVLAIENGHLFPILNYETPDPACPIHPVVDYDTPAGGNFLNLNMFGRGLASCVAVGAYAA